MRVWSCGFELGTMFPVGGNELEMTSTLSSGSNSQTPAVVASNVRSGKYSAHTKSGNVDGNCRSFMYKQFKASDSTGVFYFRANVFIDTNYPKSLLDIFMIANDAFTTFYRLRLATNGTLELWNNTGKIGSSSAVISLNKYAILEIKIDNTGVAGTNELTSRLNLVQFASSTSETLVGVDTVYYGSIVDTTPASNCSLYWDDIAINDSSGGNQNSWCGDSKIIHLLPIGQGLNHQWLKTAGGAGDSNNYQLVNEISPDDSSSFVNANSATDIDNYNIGTFPFDSTDIINVVQCGWRYSGAGASANASARLKLLLDSTNYNTGLVTPSSSTWTTNSNSTPFLYDQNITVYPTVAHPVTPAIVNNLVLTISQEINNTNAFQVSTVWVLVDYTHNPTGYVQGSAPQPTITNNIQMF